MGTWAEAYLMYGIKIEQLEEDKLPNGKPIDEVLDTFHTVPYGERREKIIEDPLSICGEDVAIINPNNGYSGIEDSSFYAGIILSKLDSHKLIKEADLELIAAVLSNSEAKERLAELLNKECGFEVKPDDVKLYHMTRLV